MTSSLFPIISQNADYDLEGLLPEINNGNVSAKFFRMVWEAYHARGVASFFLSCDVPQFYLDMHKSGCTYLHFLNTVADEQEKVTSFSVPFFDSIVCEDWETAKSIAEMSRHTHNPEEEYIDDFLYINFLMNYFFLGKDRGELKENLCDFEKNLGEDPDPRFKLCNALYDQDYDMFHESLCEMIDDYDNKYKSKYEKGLITEEKWAIDSFLFLEGLALLKLIQKINETNVLRDSNYRLIPSILLNKENRVYRPNDWLSL